MLNNCLTQTKNGNSDIYLPAEVLEHWRSLDETDDPDDLEICELGPVECRNDVECSASNKEQFKLVNRSPEVAVKSKTPDLKKCFQVKENCKDHLENNVEYTGPLVNYAFSFSHLFGTA